MSPDNNPVAGGAFEVADGPYQWNASFDDGETETGVFRPSGLEFTFTNDTFSLKAVTFRGHHDQPVRRRERGHVRLLLHGRHHRVLRG